MISSYNDFLLEKAIYELILEDKVHFSPNFINLLNTIKHPISKEILKLNLKELDKVNQNYIDTDLKSNDMISFIQNKKANDLIKDIDNYSKISDSRKHLKISDFSSEKAKANNVLIYQSLGLDIEKAVRADVGEKVKVIGEVPSPSENGKIYVGYIGVDNPSKNAVINKEGLIYVDEKTNKIWTSNRNNMKIGRLIRALLPLMDVKFPDEEIERFVNDYKSTINIMNDAFAKFDIVSGKDIAYWYNMKRYYDEDKGSLASSCMANAPKSWFEIYTDNPDVCKMVILYDDDGAITDKGYKSKKIKGRAIVWSTTNGDLFMDRIYTNDSGDEALFKKFAIRNNWWCKQRQSSSCEFTVERGSETKKASYIVQLKNWDDEFPYLDSLCYFNSGSGKLSNNLDLIDADWELHSTDGCYCEV